MPPRTEGKGSVELVCFATIKGGRGERTAQQAKVVGEGPLPRAREVLADGAAEEEDQHDGGGDPEGAVEVGVAL